VKTFPFLKSVTFILIPCLLLLSAGCYTHQTYSSKSEELPASSAFVATTDGKYYQLNYWEVDNDGNITGIGVVFQSRSDWSRLERGTPFEGTVASESIALVEANEVNLLVETTDRKCYRVVSWVVDTEGNLVCRGSAYKSRDDAEGAVAPEYFRGTLVVKDINLFEVEKFSLPRTVLLGVGILGGLFAILVLIFAATYEHG
jgi:hypothetical protein